MRLGYHASHEQFAPSDLLRYLRLAEQAGFSCAKSSDHIHPWSEKQGQSGFAWAWLGAAMEATGLPLGVISAPGYRYHPAVLAQAAATLGEMYPDRLWLSLGSGEAINEAITGQFWPEKPERNARLLECVAITRALFAGETVTHRGRVTCIEAKLYSRPEKPVPLLGAAMSEATARWCGSWADGLLTTGGDAETLRPIVAAFRENGGGSKPVILQAAMCWAETEDEAERDALAQWGPCAVGGEVNWDIRRPSDFDMIASKITGRDIRGTVEVSADPGHFAAWIAGLAELGFDEIHLHQVGRNQEAFLEMAGKAIVPEVR